MIKIKTIQNTTMPPAIAKVVVVVIVVVAVVAVVVEGVVKGNAF
jgi:hypothetical protein